MNWTPKARVGGAAAPATGQAKLGPVASTAPSANLRVSNGLKEFLWMISEIPRGRILDLGQVSQSTLNFFIEKGYRVSTEDVLRSWKIFVTEEEERFRNAPVGQDTYRVSQAELAENFLKTVMQYPEESFHGILAWDLFYYFDGEVLPRVMERLFKLLHPNGALLALFHSRPAERFHRYRVVDGQTIELLPAPTLAVHARVFQNREILDLFEDFRTSKTFVGRDQVREALFLK
jgi:hypothetical protein